MSKKQASQVVLLSGKSVQSICNVKFYRTNTIYAVNRKSDIEKFLIKKDHKVDVWVITSPLDCIELYEEIVEFLSREDDNRIISTLDAFSHILHLIEVNPLPRPDKIIFIDSMSEKVEEIVKKNKCNSNTLARLISFFLLSKRERIVLYGCDGVRSQKEKDIYFNQKDLPLARIVRNEIYRDMKMFDQYYNELVREFKRGDFIIRNNNLKSYYKSFLKEETPLNRGAFKFLPKTSNYNNNDIKTMIMQKSNLNINKYLFRKMKKRRIKDFFKKLFRF